MCMGIKKERQEERTDNMDLKNVQGMIKKLRTVWEKQLQMHHGNQRTT